jgi:hypothetical protein
VSALLSTSLSVAQMALRMAMPVRQVVLAPLLLQMENVGLLRNHYPTTQTQSHPYLSSVQHCPHPDCPGGLSQFSIQCSSPRYPTIFLRLVQGANSCASAPPSLTLCVAQTATSTATGARPTVLGCVCPGTQRPQISPAALATTVVPPPGSLAWPGAAKACHCWPGCCSATWWPKLQAVHSRSRCGLG